jgi:hypothetical protein
MALTIKNSQTIELAKRLAARTGMTQTGAITHALTRSLAETSASGPAGRRAKVDRVLQGIWLSAPPDESERIQRAMDGLYDDRGLPQ